MGRRPATYQQRRSRAFPECGRISGISTSGAVTLSRRLQIKPKLRAERVFHGRAILRHGPFFSREAASEGGVLRAVFCGEVSGRYASPSVMEIWAMRDDGPPCGRRAMSGFLCGLHEHDGGFFNAIL